MLLIELVEQERLIVSLYVSCAKKNVMSKVMGCRSPLLAMKDRRRFSKKAKELNNETLLLKIKRHGDTCLGLITNDLRYHLRCMNRLHVVNLTLTVAVQQ